MIDTLGVYREGILDALAGIDEGHGAVLGKVNTWGEDLRARLVEFASRGKLIRGSLVLAASEAFGLPAGKAGYTVAAAVELVQSFLLIHDDIMDEDPIRRGVPAVFEQYRRHACDGGFRHPSRFGESMAICGGDVAILMAISAVGGIEAPEDVRLKLITLIGEEIAKVGVAQMADVANGHSTRAATEAEILSVYRFKTGRYTFSLPLMLGAIIAGADESAAEALSTWGELQGVVFQIRDDHLGIIGETGAIGKPAGSDISANKQTLHRLYLLDRVPGTNWSDVSGFFGHDHLSSAQIRRVRDALEGTGTSALLEEKINELRAEAEAVVENAGFADATLDVLHAIDTYNAGRSI